ncbi:MAG: ABC transporter ATP-binding protein [Paludibacter sp.]|nr:ABC transporter ATP-binding protein [Paludibacter sp.]
MKLELNHITKSFGENKVLNDVTFALNEGSITVLMGTNGSGKTTLFNIISGFLTLDNGEVLLDGKNISHETDYKINRLGVTRTFQDMRLISNLTVKENLLLAFPSQYGEKWWRTIFPDKKIKEEQQVNSQKADEILSTCFIDDITDSKAGEISYGQQKLLNLACCMANDPQILLLDEPVAGVNPVFREKLATVIRQMKDRGKTLMIIEHNTDFIETVADQILFLNNGKIHSYESYRDFKNDENVKNAYV